MCRMVQLWQAYFKYFFSVFAKKAVQHTILQYAKWNSIAKLMETFRDKFWFGTNNWIISSKTKTNTKSQTKPLSEPGIEPETCGTVVWCITPRTPRQLNVSLIVKLFNCLTSSQVKQTKPNLQATLFQQSPFLLYCNMHGLLY